MGHPDPFGTQATGGAAGGRSRPSRVLRPRRGATLWPTVLIGWAIACVVLLLASAPAIAALRFPDPDDAMRMLEVRDWIAGQSWWDVAQHRLNHGAFPMHWSRLVDLPLAAVMVALDPLLGTTPSTRVAMIVVPALTLLAVMALAAVITRRVGGIAAARLAVLVVPLSVPLVYQMRPLRIDHHGWQVALALAAAWMLVQRATWVRGAATGLALATLLTISLEGMPIAAAIAGVAAAAWALRPGRRGFLLALAWTLALAAIALHAATRGPGMWAATCDAISPAWLAALAVAAPGVSAATLVERFGIRARFAALAIAGGTTGATLVLAAPACLAGPFATLPPSVYTMWYLAVLEGRPLWEQAPAWAAMTIGLPIAGLAGGVAAWRRTRGAARDRWTILLALMIAASVVAVLVNRAGATANALAVPGAAVLLHALLTRARAVPATGRRIAATVGALLAASPGQAAAIVAMALGAVGPDDAALARENDWHRQPCDYFADVRAMAAVPPALVFAPIDVSPDLIATTRHHAVAAGYHRNAAAMAVVMDGFTADPARARRVIRGTGARYLIACPGFNETEQYRAVAPNGLWSRLERGERFAWLEPVAVKRPLLAWRIR